MPKLERKLIDFISKYILIFAGAILLYLSFVCRKAVLGYISGDMEMYLIPWFYQIFGSDGLSSLGIGVGNYNIPYQTLIALLTYMRGRPEALIKYLSIVFDYVLAFASMRLAMVSVPKGTRNRDLIAFAAFFTTLYLPTVFMNSAVWGQCDAMYSSFIVLMLLEFKKEKPWAAMIMFGIAISLKLQAIFFLPFILVYYFCRKKFSILWMIEIPAMMILTSMPGLLMGRRVKDIFNIYAEQTITYPYLKMDYPNVTFFLPEKYKLLSKMCIFITFLALAIGYLIIARISESKTISSEGWLQIAIWTGFTCVMFLPSMHERYAFAVEVLLVLFAIIYKKMFIEAAAFELVAVAAYTPFLFDYTSIGFVPLSVINIIIYASVTRKTFKSLS